MKTASFFTYTGPGRISIARYAPRDVKVPRFAPLAPGAWFNSVTRAKYHKRYAAQLAKLHAASVYQALCELAGEAPPVLLCWERPPFNCRNWCHRRIVAEWFKRELGLDVAETGDRQ